MKWIVLLTFGSLGAGALVGGLLWAAKRYQLMRGGLVAQGRVVEQHEKTTTDLGEDNIRYTRTYITYHPVVEFRTARGETIRFQGSTGGAGKPVIETGTAVNVVYDASDPSKAMIADFSQAWLGPLVLSVAGLVPLALGVGGFAVIGQSDRSLETMQGRMRRDVLAMRSDAVRIRGTICRVQRLEGADSAKYVFVCKGVRPGEYSEEEFQTDHLPFEPGSGFVGRTVDIYLDPADRGNYCVELGPLLKEVVKSQAR